MILTGKCKEAFTIWMKKYPNIYPEQFEIMPEWMINALIIDFFDSVEIYVTIEKLINQPLFDCHVRGFQNQFISGSFDTRSEATTEAIKKANEIFNTTHND